MNIQPINNISFGLDASKTKNNEPDKINAGKITGFSAGLLLSGALAKTQMSALKTIEGKRNIVEGYNLSGKSLNDIMKKTPVRNSEGKIIPPAGGVSERSKVIVKSFKRTLALWGIAITAIATGLGSIADNSINTVNEKERQLKEKNL